MAKKLCAFALTVLLALSAFSPALAAQLTDISGNWAQKEIQYFVDQGYIVGYSDGTFLPEKTVTRAEFVRIVNNAFKFNVPAPIAFKDVRQGDWFYNDVSYAVAAGFISGYSDNTFKPNNNITREEVASIIQRLLQAPLNSSYAPSVFSDVDSSSHYNPYIGALTSIGVMKGTTSATFSPKSNETRADATYSLYNALFNNTTENSVVDGSVIVRKSSYGPSSEFSKETVAKNLYVRSDNSETSIRNLIVEGDFIIEDTAKRVYLQNVTIKGKLIVNGGSTLSLTKTDVQDMEVRNLKEIIRINASKDSVCYNANIFTPCQLTEDSDAFSLGFSNVVIDRKDDLYVTVDLSGRFVVVDIYAPHTAVNLNSGQISDLYFNAAAEHSTVRLNSGTVVESSEINAANTSVTGTGIVGAAKIEASNVTLASVPTTLTGSYAPKYSSDVSNYNLTMTVLNRVGVPVGGASVKVYGISKTTGANGQATFTNIPTGSHEYSVSMTGFDSVSGTLDVTGYNTTRTVTLSSSYNYSASFTVQNNATGVGISSASVALQGVSTSYTSSSGLVSFSGLPTGVYTYTVSASGYSSATDTITVNGANASKTVMLVPTGAAACEIDFYVRNDKTDALLSGATVTIGSKTFVTNAGGYVRATGLAAGSHSYVISLSGYGTKTGTASVSAGGLATVNERLKGLYTVRVDALKDSLGTLIDGASITLASGQSVYTGTTDAAGNASIAEVGPGTYTVTISKTGYQTYTSSITVNADYQLANITLS